MRAGLKLIYGIGLNDSDYKTEVMRDGVRFTCPFYQSWKNMFLRSYSKAYHKNFPTYAECSVDERWHKFSAFKQWMERQDWKGKNLDKDILFPNNKVYSPDTCVFVDPALNSFVIDSGGLKNGYPTGVSLNAASGRLVANCKNPFTRKPDYLGWFTCPQKAHEAWRAKKREHAIKLADMQSDQRVAEALRSRY